MEALCAEFCAAGVILRQYDFLAQTCHDLHECPHLRSIDRTFLISTSFGAAGWHEADRSFQDGAVVFGTKWSLVRSPGQGADDELPSSHILHGVLFRSRWHAQVISIERSVALPAFDIQAAQILKQLLAHLYRARSLGENLKALHNECSAFIAVLQHVPFACFLVNQQGYVHFANKAGAAMLGGSELRIIGDRLCGSTSRNSRLIWRAVSRVAANSATNCEVSLALPPDAENAPLILNLFPVRGNTSQASCQSEAKIAIVAKDPMGAAFSSLGCLSEMYRLTPAESRLVGLLAKQAGVFEAAGKIGISRNTARTHMRHLYAKLNVHCQADLMRLLSRFGML
jgi:DNA-binding CsgD family transcriptional regulator/PAS domain-containing protein